MAVIVKRQRGFCSRITLIVPVLIIFLNYFISIWSTFPLNSPASWHQRLCSAELDYQWLAEQRHVRDSLIIFRCAHNYIKHGQRKLLKTMAATRSWSWGKIRRSSSFWATMSTTTMTHLTFSVACNFYYTTQLKEPLPSTSHRHRPSLSMTSSCHLVATLSGIKKRTERSGSQ